MARITAKLENGTAVLMASDRHSWTADEPVALGGTDIGPTPYELLLGALAACTCTTLALYCRHKGVQLDGVEATYEYDRIHARDCEECDDPKTGFIDRIHSQVRIDGDFDEVQRKRLAQIVGRCPVHKTLENPTMLSDDVTFG